MRFTHTVDADAMPTAMRVLFVEPTFSSKADFVGHLRNASGPSLRLIWVHVAFRSTERT